MLLEISYLSKVFKRFKYLLISSFCLVVLCPRYSAQSNQIDSLNRIINSSKSHDTAKVNAYLIYGELLYISKPDSALLLWEIAHDVAETGLNRSPKYNKVVTDELIKYQSSSINNMAAIYYGQGDIEKALEYFEKSLKIKEEIEDKPGIASGLNNIGAVYKDHGDFDKAIDYYNRSLAIRIELDDQSGICGLYNHFGFVYLKKDSSLKALDYFKKALTIAVEIKDENQEAVTLRNLGSVYDSQGDIIKALESFHGCLKIAEKNENKIEISGALNNIGAVYFKQGDIEPSLEYYQKSLAIRKEIKYKAGIANSLNNIGMVYKKQGNHEMALKSFEESSKAYVEIGSQRGVATCLNNMALIYYNQKKTELALDYFNQSLELRIEMNDRYGITSVSANIGRVYFEQSGNDKKMLAKSKGYLLTALEMAQEIGNPDKIQIAALNLSHVYEKEKNGMKALEMHKIFVTMKDSINNIEIKKTAAKEQAKHEYEKQKEFDDLKHEKETAIEKEKHDKLVAIEQEAKEKQQVITYATAGGLALVIVFLLFVFNRLRITRKQKLIIEEQKEVVETAHFELEEKNQEIMDSIVYAKRIQSAILPPAKVVKEYLEESFILYKPKDIVAGDFYWLEHVSNVIASVPTAVGTKQSAHKDEIASDSLNHRNDGPNEPSQSIVLFAAADCTGHGVPGAMVSVVCNNGLNRSVREHGLTDPGKILDKTREIIIEEFEKSEEDVKDGMDIALCSLEGNKLKYAGAHNPLWIIRDGEVLVTKADKQPIGKFDKQIPYTTHSFDLQKGDTVYIFSDGYVDQFGGEKGKKFKSTAFKELLLSIQNKSMKDQLLFIDEAFENWKGSLEQIDDVCVIGVKI